MKKIIILILFAVISISQFSCSSDPKQEAFDAVYELGVNRIRENLKSPSSAKFQEQKDIKDISFQQDSTEYSLFTLEPEMRQNNEMLDSAAEASIGKLQQDICGMYIDVEAQNVYGTFLKSKWFVLGRRIKYLKSGKTGDWKVIEVNKIQ